MVSPKELGQALRAENLRYIYLSGCFGANGFRDLESESRAMAVIGHERVVMIPAIPLFALKFFTLINRRVSPKQAKEIAWSEIKSNWIFKNILIPINEKNSGEKFEGSAPVLVMR
jgi:hypothetical protein